MDRLKSLLQRRKRANTPEYEPLTEDPESHREESSSQEAADVVPFSWMEYGIFTLLGVAMLWAWCVVTQLLLSVAHFRLHVLDN